MSQSSTTDWHSHSKHDAGSKCISCFTIHDSCCVFSHVDVDNVAVVVYDVVIVVVVGAPPLHHAKFVRFTRGV